MGCACKGGKSQKMNNVDNVDFVNIAKRVDTDIISKKTIEDMDDLDKMEIINAYKVLYPNAANTPTISDAINQIKIGIETYDRKYKR